VIYDELRAAILEHRPVALLSVFGVMVTSLQVGRDGM